MNVGPLLFLTGIFFFNFLARIVLAPLMPSIEKDLEIGHDEAGSLFFLLSLGYCSMLLFSGFISSRLNHRRTIVLSSLAVGASLLIVVVSRQLWGIRIGLILTGMAAGLYLPSGIATITELASSRDWGKAIAIHEMAPNLGFVSAPFIAEFFLKWTSWRGVLEFSAIAAFLIGLLFLRFGKGGRSCGQAPNLHVFETLLKDSTFWIVAAFFALGIGAQFGVYAMLPLFLVSERGMDGSWANTLLGLSRLTALAMTFFSGWVTDRFGTKQALKAVFLSTGLATVMLGLLPGSWLVLCIFLQPMFASSFFPAGFAALSKMGSASTKNVLVSLTVPIGFLVGGGVIPAGIGLIGEAESFSVGFVLFGGFLLAGSFFTKALRLSESSAN